MSLRPPPHRPSRSLSLIAAGALVAAPLLSSCGFDYQTDQINTIGNGINERGGQIDVLGAAVIAGEPNRGVFVATLANNSVDEPGALASLGDGGGAVTPIEGTVSVEIPAAGRTSLFDEGGIPVEGSFEAGDFVEVLLGFGSGETATVEVPVVVPCRQYSLEQFPEIELPGGNAAFEAAQSETGPDGLPGPYSCETAEPVEHGAPEEG